MTLYLLEGEDPKGHGHIGRKVFESPRQRVRRAYGFMWRLRPEARAAHREYERQVAATVERSPGSCAN